ncbi:MAG: bifunctional phosphoglucose/phosphomannose isomerase [Flavobacteriales bacterium]|jgi:glucose/mannose-6-phosphate isomerase
MELMRRLITEFPDQMRDAWSIVERSPIDLGGWKPTGALVLGMGGSGISGVIASRMLAGTSPVPIQANSDYNIPSWVGSDTLVIACSYSGNTEETLMALDAAHQRGARIVAITSGGQLWDRVKANGWPVVQIPGGQPPRSQFGYAFTSVFHVLCAAGLASDSQRTSFGRVGDYLSSNQTNILERAESLADLLEGKEALLYSDAAQEGLIIRWRQQLNENSKLLCSHHVFPEMNHNELVGWEGADDRYVAVVIQTPEDHPRTRVRMDVCMEIFREQGADVVVVEGDGDDAILRFFDLVHLGDWTSLLLAERSETNPVDIRNIDHLKSALSQIPL